MADRRSMIAVTRILVCLCLCLMMLMHLGIAKNGFDDNNVHPICDHSRKLLQSPPPPEPSNSAKKGALKTVLLIGLGGICGFIVVGSLTLFLLWFAPWLRKNYNHFKNKRLRSPEQRVVVPFRSNEEGEGSSWYSEGGLSMRMSDLLTATNDFHKDRIIGYGGFGLVYKAFLPQGKVVAVKKLSMDACQGMREFQAEVEALAGIHHKHLVEILGYCKSGQERLLVYRFVENGSLDEWLHEREDPERVLDWKKRLKIIRGVAAGLSFLHHDIKPHIIHRDIKASNILLDNDFEALITDFGLARQINPQKSHISTQVAGTLGYMPPEYACGSIATKQADVYSVGMLMMEIATGRRPHLCIKEDSHRRTLWSWVRELMEEKRHMDLVDELIRESLNSDQHSEKEVYDFLRIGCLCTSLKAEDRPLMRDVVSMLEALAPQDID